MAWIWMLATLCNGLSHLVRPDPGPASLLVIYFIFHALKSWCLLKVSLLLSGDSGSGNNLRLLSQAGPGRALEFEVDDRSQRAAAAHLRETKRRAGKATMWALLMLPINFSVIFRRLEYLGHNPLASFAMLLFVLVPAEATLVLAFLLSRARSGRKAAFYRWQLQVYMLDCIVFPPLVVMLDTSGETLSNSASGWEKLVTAVYVCQTFGWGYLLCT